MGIFSDVLLTSDFDRSLTGPDSTIPANNLQAIRYFMDNGGAFTLNTGRSVPMCRPLLQQVPVNAPLLLYNGSAAYDPNSQTLSQICPIDLELWPTVLELAERYPDMLVEIQCSDAHCLFSENEAWARMLSRNGCTHRYVRPGDDLGPFIKCTLYGRIRGETVQNLFEGTPEELERIGAVHRELLERYGDKAEVFRAAARILDIHAKGVSKGRAALELKRRLGRKILVCLGDADNDLAMLQAADYPFCPADGVLAGQFPNVCPCGEGALAQVIYEKIPSILENMA